MYMCFKLGPVKAFYKERTMAEDRVNNNFVAPAKLCSARCFVFGISSRSGTVLLSESAGRRNRPIG